MVTVGTTSHAHIATLSGENIGPATSVTYDHRDHFRMYCYQSQMGEGNPPNWVPLQFTNVRRSELPMLSVRHCSPDAPRPRCRMLTTMDVLQPALSSILAAAAPRPHAAHPPGHALHTAPLTMNPYWLDSVRFASCSTSCHWCDFSNFEATRHTGTGLLDRHLHSYWYTCSYLDGAVYCSRECRDHFAAMEHLVAPTDRASFQLIGTTLRNLARHRVWTRDHFVNRGLQRTLSVLDDESRRDTDIPFRKWWRRQPFHVEWSKLRAAVTWRNLYFPHFPDEDIHVNLKALEDEKEAYPVSDFDSRYTCHHNQGRRTWDNSIDALILVAAVDTPPVWTRDDSSDTTYGRTS